MRSFVIAGTVLLACISLAFAQGWQWLNPLPQGNELDDLDYLGNNQLYSTGDYGTAIRSEDGGQTWTLANSGAALSPERTDFVSTTEGWGITTDYYYRLDENQRNSILHTTDGGLTWQIQYHDPLVRLWDVSFTSPLCGWVIGESTDWITPGIIILRTTNGGLTWSSQNRQEYAYDPHVFFLNDLQGWIACYNSVLRTSDGGTTWQSFASPNTFYHDFQFATSLIGWGSDYSHIYRTNDGGQTWTQQTLPGSNNWGVNSLAILDTAEIWAVVSNGKAFHSTNGGQSWTETVVDSNASFRKILFADATHGWICGWRGSVYQTSNGGLTWTRRTSNWMGDSQFGLAAVDFADAENGWIAGQDGYYQSAPILHTTDGGLHWNIQYWNTSQSFADIKAVSATNIWAVGTAVVHSTDGGLTWNTVDLGEYYHHKVVCPNDQVIWISSGGNRLHRSTDGGVTWDSHTTSVDFVDFTASDANNVWTANYYGCLTCLSYPAYHHSTDGGQTWTAQLDGAGDGGSVCFLDSLNGWAMTWPGLRRTTDGGANWITVNDTLWGYRIEFLDAMNGWVSGTHLFRTTDGGVTWQCFDPYVEDYSFDMDFTNMSHGWIISSNGALLSFDGSILDTPEPTPVTPATFALHPAYPNPFNSVTNLTFELPSASRAKVELFDISGRLVQTISDRQYTSGIHTISFDARDLPSGVYLTRVSAGTLSATQKLLLIR